MINAKTIGTLFVAGAIAGLAAKKVVKGSESGVCGFRHQETTTNEAPGRCGTVVQAYES